MRKLSQTEELVKILAGRARRHTLTPEQISRAMDEQEYDVSGLDALYAALEARGILGGLPVEGGLLWCCTELVSGQRMDETAAIAKEVLGR